MKKHRLDNGDYPYENGHMNGEFKHFLSLFFPTPLITLDSVSLNEYPLKNRKGPNTPSNIYRFVAISWNMKLKNIVIYC